MPGGRGSFVTWPALPRALALLLVSGLAVGTAGPAGSTGTAAERVTLVARPRALAAFQPAILFGTVSSGRENETVTVEAKDCGRRSFTGVAAVLTHPGGTYTLEFSRGINTTVRAVWRGEASALVTIRQQVRVDFVRLGSGRYSVSGVGRTSLWRKRAQVQRRSGGRWRTIKTVVLSDSGAPPGSPIIWSTGEFALKVPRGSILRAVLHRSQVRPCYLAGVSRTVTT